MASKHNRLLLNKHFALAGWKALAFSEQLGAIYSYNCRIAEVVTVKCLMFEFDSNPRSKISRLGSHELSHLLNIPINISGVSAGLGPALEWIQ